MKILFFLSLFFVTFILSACLEDVYRGSSLAKSMAFRQWTVEHAKDGDAAYQYKAGQLYCCGERPDYDNVEALHWFCEAARNGQRDAMLEVGRMYEEANTFVGDVIPRDLMLAHTFYTLAQKHENKEAEEKLTHIKKFISEEDIKKSELLVSMWPNIHCGVRRR